MVTNGTASDIVVEYEVLSSTDHLPIFYGQPLAYKLTSDDAIYWNETTKAVDLDSARCAVKVVLPPNHGLIIGGLSNDTYERYDQYFINGRHFDLEHLRIRSAGSLTEIEPNTFDDHFVKKKSVVTFLIE